MCRKGAQDLSTARKDIEALGGALVGIGLERFGFEEFAEGGYFDGPVYIDETKACYKALFQRNGLLNGFGMLNPKVWSAAKASKAAGVGGNMKGDGTQMGGVVVISGRGSSAKVTMLFKQSHYGDHPSSEDVVKAVRDAAAAAAIGGPAASGAGAGAGAASGAATITAGHDEAPAKL